MNYRYSIYVIGIHNSALTHLPEYTYEGNKNHRYRIMVHEIVRNISQYCLHILFKLGRFWSGIASFESSILYSYLEVPISAFHFCSVPYW